MILLRQYDCLTEYRFNPDGDNPSGIVRINPQDVPLFFKKCGNNGNKYIIISFDSDYGIDYQEYNHPNMDLAKMVHYYKWDEIQSRKEAYVALGLGPACVYDNCNTNDKYSIKVYSFTHATFNEIPDNIVRWYSNNVNINHPKVIGWPIGYHDGIAKVIDNFVGLKKDKLCYANFRNHTMERLSLNNYFKKQNWCKTVTESVPVEEYLKDISESKFTICPPGVGYDTFRIYESLKLGTIPIVLRAKFAEHLLDLPVLFANSYNIDNIDLDKAYNDMLKYNWRWEKITLDYWINLVNQDKKLL